MLSLDLKWITLHDIGMNNEFGLVFIILDILCYNDEIQSCWDFVQQSEWMLQLSQCCQWMSSISTSSVQWLDIEYYESDTRRLTAMGHQTGLVKLAVVDAVKTGLFKQKNMNPCQTIDPYLHVHYSNFTCTNKKN